MSLLPRRYGVESSSCRLMAIAGWLRFGCTNGLIIGTASMQLRQQHRQQLEVGEIGRLVGEAIESTGSDKAMDAGCLGLLPLPHRGRDKAPLIRSITRAPDQTATRPWLLHC